MCIPKRDFEKPCYLCRITQDVAGLEGYDAQIAYGIGKTPEIARRLAVQGYKDSGCKFRTIGQTLHIRTKEL